MLAKQAQLAQPSAKTNQCVVVNGSQERARGDRARVVLAYQYLPPYDKDEYMGYVEPTETGAIAPPILPPNIKLDITSAIIEMLNLKSVLSGEAIDDAKIHLENFTKICTSCTIPVVEHKALRLRLFPFSLTSEASLWLGELTRGSNTTWYDLHR